MLRAFPEVVRAAPDTFTCSSAALLNLPPVPAGARNCRAAGSSPTSGK
ncbi:hypothetical protein ACRAWF_15135 [Streptomyces sp. L7]